MLAKKRHLFLYFSSLLLRRILFNLQWSILYHALLQFVLRHIVAFFTIFSFPFFTGRRVTCEVFQHDHFPLGKFPEASTWQVFFR